MSARATLVSLRYHRVLLYRLPAIVSHWAAALLVTFPLLLAGCGLPPMPPVASVDQVRFAVIGDYGVNDQNESAVADLVKNWQPDFIVTVGDNNYPDGDNSTIDANIGRFYHEYIHGYTGHYGAGSADQRFYVTLGNHDWLADRAAPYLDYFALPGNERYYAAERRPVGLFVLDSDPSEPDGTATDSVQARWLQAALASSDACWKLVFLHHPPFSSGLRHGSSSRMQWPYAQWGADAVMSGHEHNYERLVVDDLPYFVNGLGGAVTYPFGVPLNASQVRYNLEHGAMLVQARGGEITFQFVNRLGEVVDAYTRQKSCPEAPAPLPK